MADNSQTTGWRLAIVADARTGVKITAIVAVLAAAALVVGIVAIVSLSSVFSGGQAIATQNLTPSIHLATLRDLAQQARIAVRDAVIATDAAATKKVETKIQTLDASLDAAADLYGSEATDKAAITQFKDLWTQYRAIRDQKLIPAAEANNFPLAVSILTNQTAPLTTEAFAQLDLASQAEQAQAASVLADAKSTYTGARRLVIVILAVGLLIGLAMAWYVTRLVLRPLRIVSTVLDRVAEGDLTHVANVPSRDELGRMAQALDRANARTREVVQAFTATAQTLASSAEELSATSREISNAADQASAEAGMVSSSAEEVSTSVQTVAASSEEMTTSISEIARNATEAAQVAAQAVESAQTASDTMTELGRSSEEVGNVISRNIAEAATGATEIARSVQGVASAAQTTTEGVSQSQIATADVARMSTELQQLASQFRV
ncbi:methyl-accepting chemotaxis protein [Actinoplanes tereljensis]|uniref:Methyl-accepting chemotaxis protein n=1 Tax=Paractinoplanes tereljensis TaxID=571912 RepID=A0A919NS28_9ACTN|nr:methyl-accepting chemotaxis protein [Actinoplanes tereljensis]GIF22949.1 hypothetical protein Ate02nite_56790 [Actinoplanes tereljensis]